MPDTVIPFARRYKGAGTDPLIVFLDFQMEFVTAGRMLAIESAAAALDKARQVLAVARECKLPIAHLRLIKRGHYFNPTLPFTDWIEGLEPRAAEMVFEHDQPSAYASEAFAAMMTEAGGEHVVLLGLSGNVSCLATLVEGFRLDHHYTYLHDASASPPLSSAHSETATHDAAGLCAAAFADVITTQTFINRIDGKEPQVSSGA